MDLKKFFKKIPDVAKRKLVKLEISRRLVRHYPGRIMGQLSTGRAHCYGLPPEVQDWCKENNIKFGQIIPTAVFGESLIGPFFLELYSERDAIFFKMMWSDA